MEFIGTIIEVGQRRSGKSKTTGNDWEVQEYVIEGYDQYHKKMVFEVFGGEQIDRFGIVLGEALKVFFDVDATNYNGRWFNRIKVYKVERLTNQTVEQAVSEYTTDEPF